METITKKRKLEKLRQQSTTSEAPNDLLPPPCRVKTDAKIPALKRSHAILGEMLANMDTSSALIKLLGHSLHHKKEVKHISSNQSKKKPTLLRKIQDLGKNADLTIKQLQALLPESDISHKQQLQKNSWICICN